MATITCSNCRRITTSDPGANCPRCNAVLSVTPNPNIGLQIPPFLRQIQLPSFLNPIRIGAGILILIVGWFGITFLFEWKAERSRKTAEQKQASLVANFDYVTFNNDERAVENALKVMPTIFNLKPPIVDPIRQYLTDTISQKDYTATKKDYIDDGTREVTTQLKNYGSPGAVIGSVGSAVMTSGSAPGGTYDYKYKVKAVKTITTDTRNTNQILDLKILDFSYVKAPGKKLVCFVRYEVTTGVFQYVSSDKDTSNPIRSGFPGAKSAPYNAKPEPIDPLKPWSKPIGNKIKDIVGVENARFEMEDGKWVMKVTGISESDKVKQIDELKTGAKIAPQK